MYQIRFIDGAANEPLREKTVSGRCRKDTMWKSEDIWQIVEDKKAAYGKAIHKLSKHGSSLKKCEHNTKIHQEWQKYYQTVKTSIFFQYKLGNSQVCVTYFLRSSCRIHKLDNIRSDCIWYTIGKGDTILDAIDSKILNWSNE